MAKREIAHSPQGWSRAARRSRLRGHTRFNARMRRADIAVAGMQPLRAVRAILHRYFSARGPHLAAMLAYYALLSLFPFVFLAASLVSAIGRPAETSALLQDLSHVLPGTSAHDLARFVRSLGVERHRDRDHRPRRAALVVARLLLGARVRA